MKTENQNNNLVDFTPDSSRNDSSQEEIIPRYPIPDIEKNNVVHKADLQSIMVRVITKNNAITDEDNN